MPLPSTKARMILFSVVVFFALLLVGLDVGFSMISAALLGMTLRAGAGVDPEMAPLTIDGADVSEMQADALPELPPAGDPLALLGRLVVPEETRAQLELLIASFHAEILIYDTWGLRKIAPSPRYALTLHGPSGTGKTLAAHAVASALGKKVLAASCSQLESLHFGGPDTLEAAFAAAERENAILLIEDAHLVLSPRLSAEAPMAEPPADALRSRLLRYLDQYPILVVFATSLSGSYHPLFQNRVPYLAFSLPDTDAQYQLWQKHFPPEMPLGGDVSIANLVEAGASMTGRDIKNAVLRAATQAAIEGSPSVTQSHFLAAIEKLTAS